MAIYGGAGIGAVIGWKFNHQAGMETVNGVITAFPVTSGVTLTDGIPSNEDIATWTNEYNAAMTMIDIRAKRDALLTATDWWGASDNGTMSDARTAYRLALRHYPATYEDDNAAAWPTNPDD